MERVAPDRETVRLGAAWLDQRLPDWYRHINLNVLDLSSGSLCILAQLAPRMLKRQKTFFTHSPVKFSSVWLRRRRMGFPKAAKLAFFGNEFLPAWREEIRTRLSAAEMRGHTPHLVIQDEDVWPIWMKEVIAEAEAILAGDRERT